MKYLHLISIFFVLSCSEKAKVVEDFSESKVIKLEPVKKPIVAGNKKYEGPDKIMYIFEGRKHGDIDLSKPSRFGVYPPDINERALKEMKKRSSSKYSISNINPTSNTFSTYAQENAVFEERGPYNAPGRVRSIIVDSRDNSNKTWIIGGVGGGIYKTTDSGVNYEHLSPELDNAYITALVQGEQNPNIIYAGAGAAWTYASAGFSGGSMYKSNDGGNNWNNISLKDSLGNVDQKFRSISRMVIDPNDDDILTIATWAGSSLANDNAAGFIYRTEDGGNTWNEIYQAGPQERITQLVSSPKDSKIIYASVSQVGVLKSTDGGKSWYNPGNLGLTGSLSYDNPDGLYNVSGSSNFERVEIDVSRNNPNLLYLAATQDWDYVNTTGNRFSKLFVSYDGATTWNLIRNDDGTDDDWLNGIGWFANSIMIHPFNDSIIYHASANMQRSKLLPKDGVPSSTSSTIITTENISSKIKIQNIWGGSSVGVGTDWDDYSSNPDFENVEIRFGPEKTQKAYRFSVPEGSTTGVSSQFYTYQDYVDVPFEVWNMSTDPAEQMTVSFRDNNNNGKFDLNTDFNLSREYLFTQNIPYDETMSQSDVSKQNGQLHKTTFLVWLYSQDGTTWDESSLPESKINITNVDATLKTFKKDLINITDYYTGATINQNVHVDHHIFKPIPNENDSTFSFILGTDGGVVLSKTKKDPGIVDGDFFNAGVISDNWYEAQGGLNTTLVWGSDKVKGKDQYLLGAQDHGTFLSNKNFDASDTSMYVEQFGGDGFEVLTHFDDPLKMFAGSQYNNTARSLDGGETWLTVPGIPDYRNGPFNSQYETSYQDPDVVYSISRSGVGRSNDWGATWTNTQITGANWENVLQYHDVKVSRANPRFVWAGGFMGNFADIYVSSDWGETYSPVNDYSNMGVISGIYTHPTEDSTAFILFSFYGFTKIIETNDLGNTWKDISGFGPTSSGVSVSSKGFPNVAVHSLIVMPNDPNIIWVGTDIGLVETRDRGNNWHLVESNLPHVAIMDMKLKDEGQIVITTYGRGVWTATIDDLKDYEPKPAIIPPVIQDAKQVDDEALYIINSTIQFKSVYDSLEIAANGTIWKTIKDSISIETKDIIFNVDSKGNYTLQAFGYKDGVSYPSNTFDLYLNPTLEPRTEYSTTFSDLVGDEFGLDRFRIGSQGGFQGRQLHTEHPYESGVAAGYDNGYSVHALLNIPIIITDYTPSIRFKEIVLVEPGEPGTSYGDYGFWDYVIVEASKDGEYWKELIDGYDSDADPAWRSAYNSGAFGSPDLIRDRQINFSPHFSVGDTVKVRFRMFSDDLTVSWGWMVDDLYIQKDLPVVQGIEFTELDKDISIYPNPTSGEFSIDFNDTWQGDVNCRITDIFGRSIYTNTLDNKSSNSSHKIDIRDSNDGVYIIQLVQGEKKTMKKIIKE